MQKDYKVYTWLCCWRMSYDASVSKVCFGSCQNELDTGPQGNFLFNTMQVGYFLSRTGILISVACVLAMNHLPV